MAAIPTTDFDLGPLSWVKTEIDHSLNQARENLDKLAANAADRAPVKYILTHLHQATGALAMVGLGAATRFNEELEKLVAFLEAEDAAQMADRVATAKKGIGALSAYLDMLLAGEADYPMRLLGPYLELNHARGQNDANEGDLFYPNLGAHLPPLAEVHEKLDDAVLAKALAHQRSLYQQGLLRMLKGGDTSEALRQMHGAIQAIESLQGATANRPFWTAASAFLDALVFGGLEATPAVKPLFAKLDQSVKQLIDGKYRVAERVFRDLLLSVGRSRTVSDRIGTLKSIYRLDQLLLVPERAGRGDDEGLGTLVRELRDLTVQQKDTWLKYTSGNRAALEPFGKQATAIVERAAKLPQGDIVAVLSRLTEVAPVLKASAIPPSEAQSLEVATALLFIESALENYSRLGGDFPKQAGAVVDRLGAAMKGEALAPMETIAGGLLDEMTRRAQEKLLVFQVGQEVQVNLQNIEAALDAFFRDNAKRAELAKLPAQFSQVQGALMIMELADAASLNAAVMAKVQEFADGSLDGTGEAAEMVADGLSALGLYITALQQGSSAPQDVLHPALLRFGLVERPPVEIESELTTSRTVAPADIELQKQKVQALYEDWKDAPAEETREKLEKAVDDLAHDASVVADSEVAQQSEAALAAIKGAAVPDTTGVFEAMQELAPEKAPETPAPQVVQLVDAPGAEIDRELLEIFLEEATEVVSTIVASLESCRGAPHDRESLTTIRRGFHTLKGSGRMVGLMELGEVAWQCEQVMNKFLKDEKPASPSLLGFIDLAQASFAKWVQELKDRGEARIDGSEISRQAELLKNDQEVTPAPATSPPPAAVEPPAAPADEPVIEIEPQPGPAAEPTREPEPAPAAFSFESLDLTAPAEPAPSEPIVAPQPEAEPEPVVEAPQPEPVANAPAVEAPSFDFAEIAPAAEEEEITIGSVTLPKALFAIYIGEAEQHIASMQREMRSLETDRHARVTADFMRAAHTLASSSRTTDFHMLAEVSHALEKWLQDAMEVPTQLSARGLAVTRGAVDALTAMVESVRGNALPYPRREVIAELVALRDANRREREREAAAAAEHAPPPGRVAERIPEPVAQAAPEPVIEVAPAPVVEAATEPIVAAAVLPVAEQPHVAPESAAAEVPSVPAEAPAPAFEAGKDQRRIKDDVDRDLLPIFIDEAKEIVPLVSEGVRRWKSTPTDHSPVAELARHLHTLKGSARMTGLMRLGELAHVLETKILAMDADASPGAANFEHIEERVDRFSVSLERLTRGEDIVEEPVEVPVAAVFEHQRDKPSAIAVIAAAAQQVAQRDALPPEMREQRAALLRVNADLIDAFVNEAGELSIARSRIEGEMAAFRRAMTDLAENIGRMRAQLREIEIGAESQMQSKVKEQQEHGAQFDPLEFDRFSRMQELTRFLAESLGDVITLQQSLQKNLDEADLAIHAQARLNRELQQGLMGVRLVPLGNLSDRLYRVVRQTAKELDKKANLELKGTRTELDRSVLEKITAPFEHLLRNAVAHGIEKPEARLASGKAEIGEISIDAVQRGNEVVLTIADDGGGLNFKRIREKAIDAKLLAPDAEMPEAQLAQFIFMAGFSTATELSEVAGRGVGMDVVKNEITSLGGRVELSSTPGRGTTFTITLPLTLAVTQGVMVRANQTSFLVPSVMIDQVQEYKAQPYAELLAKGEVVWKDNRYPLRSLLPLLGEIDTPTPARQIPVLLLKSGLARAAIRVDEILGNREVVVKSIGPQLSRLAGIAGATVLGNGQVVLILNPVQLVHREGSAEAATSAAPQPVQSELVVEESSGAPLVMVVDDSLTVRKITSRMLAREGYEVATAKDGVDALQQLQDIKPNCILLDVEMPRMDGFEFARNVRADEATRSIPIIMITSRTADKHRNHATEIGVNEYMGKPYQEDQLLALIKRYTHESALA
jgi:chemosensory pili system protein ChpA (sensor histidine kinase/response regulator)